MSKIKVWLDCDPGHDDMLAIIMAALNERIDLIGISTSAGNSVI
jgi:inosine-uridine nucleoside N-ribohydrolase